MAFPSWQSRWLRDDAVLMQLREADGNYAMMQASPEPDRVRAWFVSLCFFRHDQAAKSALEQALTQYRWKLNWTPAAAWLTTLKFQIEDDPAAYPFSLDEREFAYYARENFGDQVQNIEGIYHPPVFYQALVQDVFGFVVGASFGVVASLTMPEAAAGAAIAVRVAPKLAQAAIGSATGSLAARLMPGGAWDAARKDRLWPRYELDWKRRQLT